MLACCVQMHFSTFKKQISLSYFIWQTDAYTVANSILTICLTNKNVTSYQRFRDIVFASALLLSNMDKSAKLAQMSNIFDPLDRTQSNGEVLFDALAAHGPARDSTSLVYMNLSSCSQVTAVASRLSNSSRPCGMRLTFRHR